jgi:hypothetical protein
MLNDWLDRIRDALNQADTNDWIAAVIIAALAMLIVLLVLRIVGFLFRFVRWLLALAAAAAVGLYILDHRGVPSGIGGDQIERWIEHARRYLGV